MLAAAIRGPKKSGKTAVTGLLAEALERRGKRVAIIKHSSHPVDIAATDSFWLMRPGRTVVAASAEETAVFYSRELSLERMIPLLDADVLLVEGGDVTPLPVIYCVRDEEENVVAETGDAMILARIGEGSGPEAPVVFDELTPETADSLASLVLERGRDVDPAPSLLIHRKGEPIPLPAEAEQAIRNAVSEAVGMSLAGLSLDIRLGGREGA